MNDKDLDRLFELRKELFKAIHKSLEEDGACKSYEGLFELGTTYKDYFDDTDGNDRVPEFYRIHLDCYVIGPNRHYDWCGNSFEEAFSRCKTDVENWIEKFKSECK